MTVPILWESMDLLAARAQATPARLALWARQGRWTYADLDRWAHAWAAQLWAWGLRPGHRVALAARPQPVTLALVWAVWRAGLTLAPVHLRFGPAEAQRALARLRPALLLADPEARAWLQAAEATGTAVQPLPGPWPEAPPRAPDWRPPQQPVAGPALLLFTSGTTRAPKLAALTQANLFWSALASGYRLGVVPEDRWLLTLPLYHVGGLSVVVRSALYGTAIVLPEARPSFDPEALWTTMERTQTTLVSLVPTMLYRLLQRVPERAPSSLRVLLLGGAAARPELIREAFARGYPVALTYGLTEAASQVATAGPELTRRKPGTVGRPLLFTHVRVVDDAGRDLPAGQVGELWVRGPNVFAGYVGDPDATARAFAGAWLRTGDMGYWDADGHLWVLARRADLIVSGGENIAPAEVEQALLTHPAVAEAAVVGIPDPEWGQRVAAAVVLRPGAHVTPAALEAHVRERLAGYKVPRVLRIVPALPRTASGKIRRAEVRGHG